MRIAPLPSIVGAAVLAALITAAPLAAQSPIHALRIEGVAGVFAGNSFRTSANNQAIPRRLALTERFSRGSQVLATCSSVAQRLPTGCRLSVFARSTGRGASCGTSFGSNAIPAPQKFRLIVVAGTPQLMDIVCRYRGKTTAGAQARATLTTNFGNATLIPDGTLRTTTIRDFPVRQTDNNVFIEVGAQCAAASATSVDWDIQVSLVPKTRCTASYGTASCGAAIGTLSGRVRGLSLQNNVEVDFETITPSLVPATVATLLVCPSGQTVGNLPGFVAPSCTMFAAPPIVVATGPVTTGVLTHRMLVPPSLKTTIWFQTLLSRPVNNDEALATTNTVQLVCR